GDHGASCGAPTATVAKVGPFPSAAEYIRGPSAWMFTIRSLPKENRRVAAVFMELAGLEPATSWVRFMREPSPPFATVRRQSQTIGNCGTLQRHHSRCFVVAT